MSNYSDLIEKMRAKNIPFSVRENNCIDIYDYNRGCGAVRVMVGFNNEDDNRPSFHCYDLGNFPKEKTAAALVACNNANIDYRWVRFYLDDDNDVVAAADAVVDEFTSYDEIMEMVFKISGIVNKVYESFMQARWT